jgi:hypothetical protein
MRLYNVIVKNTADVRLVYIVQASTWANAIIAAKKAAGLATDSSTDPNLILCQLTTTTLVVGS